MCIEKITKARRMLGTVSLDDFKRYQIPDRWERRIAKKKNPRTNRSFKNSATRRCGKDRSEKKTTEKKFKLHLRMTDS